MRKKARAVNSASKIAIRSMKINDFIIGFEIRPSSVLTSLPVATVLSFIRSAIISRYAGATLFRARRPEGERAQRFRERAQVGARRKRRQNVMILGGVGRKRSTGYRAPRERRT